MGDDELRQLRRRAYGPDADIAHDPLALARLAALEERARQAATAGATAVAGDVADDGDPSAAEPPDAVDALVGELGLEPGDPGGDMPASPITRRRLILACAITTAVTAAVAIPATLGAIAFAERPDAVLHAVDDSEEVRYFDSRLDEGSRAYGEFYGIEIVVGSFEGSDDTCLLVRLGSLSGDGTCTPRGLDPQLNVAARDAPRAAREEFGDDAALRFVVSGADVLVYVLRPDPGPTREPAPVDDA
ncbi:MAG TPA: hypothetical protein VEP72_08360 [Microbacterium sp.]|nr:hypothetical protein [Microbacterium sp.]